MLNSISHIIKRIFKKIKNRTQQKRNNIHVEEWLAYYQAKPRRQNNPQLKDNLEIYPYVSIIILTYNNLAFTKLCLESIYVNTNYPNFEVILVDNASTDKTPNWLTEYAKSHDNLRIILNSENRGFAGGNNQAVKIAKGEYLIFLNNDTVVTYGWVNGLLNHIRLDSNIGLVGPVTNSTGNEARIVTNYDSPLQMELFAEARSEKMAGISFDIRMLAFFCVIARKDQYQKIGGLDEQFGVGMFEDDDLALRYQQLGYRVVCVEDVFIHHFQGASFGKLESQNYSKIFDENRKKYEKKWNRVWEPYKLRPEVMNYLWGEQQ